MSNYQVTVLPLSDLNNFKNKNYFFHKTLNHIKFSQKIK